jgi:hypothetical protein
LDFKDLEAKHNEEFNKQGHRERKNKTNEAGCEEPPAKLIKLLETDYQTINDLEKACPQALKVDNGTVTLYSVKDGAELYLHSEAQRLCT